MSEQQFDIIFRGDIVFGQQLADVKGRLQQLFKADAAKVDALFSGRPVPLKRGLDQASAQKYKEALHKAGALVDLVPTPNSNSIAAAPTSLAQRLQAQQVADEQQARAKEMAAKLAAEQAAKSAPTAPTVWSLAPVGAILSQPNSTEATPVEVDTSFISLRPEGGNLLDESELPPVSHTQVSAPDYEVAPPGADLVRPEEKMELPLVEIELEDWTIAEVGAELISASEKSPEQIKIINELHAELAPVGADLGQLKPQVNAVVPDTSGISLAE